MKNYINILTTAKIIIETEEPMRLNNIYRIKTVTTGHAPVYVKPLIISNSKTICRKVYVKDLRKYSEPVEANYYGKLHLNKRMFHANEKHKFVISEFNTKRNIMLSNLADKKLQKEQNDRIHSNNVPNTTSI